jgi:hypothetical protein
MEASNSKRNIIKYQRLDEKYHFRLKEKEFYWYSSLN